jgi:hypothetical protein
MENYGLMTLDEMIKRIGKDTNAWIFENGKIKSDVLAIDTRDFLEELKKYEVEDYTIFYPLIEKLREEVKNSSYFRPIDYSFCDIAKNSIYTYNWESPLSHNVVFDEFEYNDVTYVAVCTHIGMDARYGFTFYSILECDLEDIYELEFYPSVDIEGTNLVADLKWYSDCYDVYDLDTGETYDGYNQMEMKYLLLQLKEDGVIKDASEVLNDN